MSLAFFSLHWRCREWHTKGKEDLFFGTLVWRFLKIRNLAHLPNLCMDMGSTNFMEKTGHAKCGCKLKTLSCLCSHFSLFIGEDKQKRARAQRTLSRYWIRKGIDYKKRLLGIFHWALLKIRSVSEEDKQKRAQNSRCTRVLLLLENESVNICVVRSKQIWNYAGPGISAKSV